MWLPCINRSLLKRVEFNPSTLTIVYFFIYSWEVRACVEVKGQHEGVGCLLPPCGTWTLNLGHQAWQWVLLLTEPSTPWLCFCGAQSWTKCLCMEGKFTTELHFQVFLLWDKVLVCNSDCHGTCCIDQAGFELILQPLTLKYWDYRPVSLTWHTVMFYICAG